MLYTCGKRDVSFGLLIRSVSFNPKGIGTFCVWAEAMGSIEALAVSWFNSLWLSTKSLRSKKSLLGNRVHDNNSRTEAPMKKDLESSLLTIAIVHRGSDKLTTDRRITFNSRTKQLPWSVVQSLYTVKKTRKRHEAIQGCSRNAKEKYV